MISASRTLLLVLGLVLLGNAICVHGRHDALSLPQREIRVPMNDLPSLLQGLNERILLTREEYAKLLQDAHRTPEQMQQAQRLAADLASIPADAIVTLADYAIEIQPGRARIQGVLTIDVLKPGLQAIPLCIHDVGIVDAQLDGRPAKLARSQGPEATAESPCMYLMLDGIGVHELKLDMLAAVNSTVAQQSIQAVLPRAASSTWVLSASGNVELVSGAVALNESYDANSDVSQFQLVPQSSQEPSLLKDGFPLGIVLSLNNKRVRDSRVLEGRSRMLHVVAESHEQVIARIEIQVHHGSETQFQLEVPRGFDIMRVHSPNLQRWRMKDEPSPDSSDTKLLVLEMREPVVDHVVFELTANRDSPIILSDAPHLWTSSEWQIVDCHYQSAVVALMLQDELLWSDLDAGRLIPIDKSIFQQSFPNDVVESLGIGTGKLIAAWYAPWDRPRISAKLAKPARKPTSSVNLMATVNEASVEMDALLAVTASKERISQIEVQAPAGWRLQSAKNRDGASLTFDVLDKVGANSESNEGEEAKVRINLVPTLSPEQSARVHLNWSSVPEGWLSDWNEKVIEIPKLTIVGIENVSTVVSTNVEGDMTLTSSNNENLIALFDGERDVLEVRGDRNSPAFIALRPNWKLALTVQRISPQYSAELFSFFKVNDEEIRAEYELYWGITSAHAHTLTFSLPGDTPPEMTIRGLEDVLVKEYSSQLRDGRRYWNVSLDQRRSGRVGLSLFYSMKRIADSEQKLPIPRADQALYQNGVISVEGDDALDISIVQHPRVADVGELTPSQYTVGNRLLGVYSYSISDNEVFTNNEDAISIRSTQRQLAAVPSTIIQQLAMVSAFSTSERALHFATVRLKSIGGYIQIRLPDQAELWSITLDGKPTLPQRNQERLVMEISPTAANSASDNNSANALRELSLVYETPLSFQPFRAVVPLQAPEFASLSDDRGREETIPIANTQWQLWTPRELKAVDASGDLELQDARMTFPSSWLKSADDWSRMELPTIDIGRKISETASSWDSQRTREDAIIAEPLASAAPKSNTSQQAMPVPMAAAPSVALQEDPFAITQIPQAATPPSVTPLAPVIPDVNRPAKSPSSVKWLKDLQSMDGLKTLPIGFDRPMTFQSIELKGFPETASIQLTIVNDQRLQWLSRGLCLAAIAIGLMFHRRPLREFLFWSIVACVVILMMPLGLPWSYECEAIAGSLFLGIAASVIVRIAADGFRSLVNLGAKAKAATAVARTAMILIAISFHGGFANAQSNVPRSIATWDDLVKTIQSADRPLGALEIPADAILVPYDADKAAWLNSTASGVPSPQEKILIPYATYKHLWELAHPSLEVVRDAKPTPTEYSLSDFHSETSLVNEDSLVVDIAYQIDVHASGTVLIPFALEGAVLTNAMLDDQPASLRTIQNTSVLVCKGASLHRVKATFRVPVVRQGGWRSVDAILPSTPYGSLSINGPESISELRIAGPRGTDQVLEIGSRETVRASFPASGKLKLQWRSKVAESTPEQGLNADLEQQITVDESGIHSVWNIGLQFRRGRRERFEFQLPANIVVEKIVGPNVRGWKTEPQSDLQRLEIELLKPASESEQISVHAMIAARIGESPDSLWNTPRLEIPEASTYQGTISLSQSSLLELDIVISDGLAREDVAHEAKQSGRASLVPIKAFQSYRFRTKVFGLAFRARKLDTKLRTQMSSVLRVSRNDAQWESDIQCLPGLRPVHRIQVQVPADWNWDAPRSSVAMQWTLSESAQGIRTYDILTDGQSRPFSIAITAKQDRSTEPTDSESVLPVPQVRVMQADQQQGDIRVFTDVGVDAIPELLERCERIAITGLPSTSSILKLHPSVLRCAIRYNAADYRASVRLRSKTPQIGVMSISNVKLTRRSLEETIYIEWNMREAGVHQLEFALPSRWKDATVQAPMIRTMNKVIDNATDDPKVKFTLELQDDILGQYRVLVQKDSPLPTGVQEVPIPSNLTGTVDSQLVTLENSGSNELVTESLQSVVAMVRGESQWVQLASLLGGKSADAFRVEPSSDPTAPAPQLTYRARTRSLVETVAARIPLARSTISVDRAGGFRAHQEFRVENTSEPFLEIELPPQAKLWTATVAELPVKVMESPNKANHPGGSRIRIPLVRTQTGDLDYGVHLKYAGKLSSLGWSAKIDFPLIDAINIHVELSQVQVMLPKDHYWYRFDGTLGQVHDSSDFLAGWLMQKNKQIGKLAELAANNDEAFSKARAEANLMQLESEVTNQLNQFGNATISNSALQQQIQQNRSLSDLTKQQSLNWFSENKQEPEQDNRKMLNSLYANQSNGRAGGNIDSSFGLPNQFDTPAGQSQSGAKSKYRVVPNPTGKPSSRAQQVDLLSNNDSRSLAEQYKSKIQGQAMLGRAKGMAGPANAYSDNMMQSYGMGYGGGSTSQDYAKSRAAGGMGGMGGGAMVGGGYGGESGMGPGAEGGAMGMTQLPPTANPNQRRNQVPGGRPDNKTDQLFGTQAPMGDRAAQGSVPSEAGGYLASLDVDFEATGNAYYFVTPRGNATLSASGISVSALTRYLWLAGGIGVLAILITVRKRFVG
jgi:hypothetical protein